jgi:threonine dehydrogenase-like Zn-dependent dehydrogenase
MAPIVLDLVERGTLDPARIITETVPFSGAVEGMLSPATKVVFVNDFAQVSTR